MHKRIIIALVLLMGISLLGIIGVQFYWFNNSVKVRNELFDRSVNDAMNKTVQRMETIHDIRIIRNMGYSDSLNAPIPPPPIPPVPDFEDIDVVVKKDSVTGKIRVITSRSRSPKSENPTSGTESTIGKSRKSIRIITRDTDDSIITDDIIGTINDSMVIHGLPGIELKVQKKMEQLQKLSHQITNEYRGWQSGRHIDEDELKRILKEELVNREIPIDFEFAINTPGNLVKDNNNASVSRKWYRVNLYPNDIFRKNLELAVYFPDRNLFIGRTTTLLLGLSVAFTLIIFLTFALSIFLILRQKKISEMKSDFINNMTHEFKTPIATISIASDSILNEKVINNKAKVRFFTEMIKKENLRMNEQVERILQIARLDRKEFKLNFQSVDAHELISEAIEVILLQVKKRGGKIETKLEATNPVVTTDPVHFTNVIYNLLDNANKYSSDEPQITVTTTNYPKGITITVEDHGIGISKAAQAKIFDKFYRLPSGNVHNVKGFGLGLSYVKAILDANNGSIKVHSEPGKGSRFVIFVPYIINRR